MNFADSLNENEIKRRRREQAQEEKKRAINFFICNFEDYIKRHCTRIAESGGKRFSGYITSDTDEFGSCLVIHDFPDGNFYTPSNGVCGLGTDKEYVEALCKKMSDILRVLGFKRFSVDAKWIMLQKEERYKPWLSNYTQTRIIDDHEEYAIYIDICW